MHGLSALRVSSLARDFPESYFMWILPNSGGVTSPKSWVLFTPPSNASAALCKYTYNVLMARSSSFHIAIGACDLPRLSLDGSQVIISGPDDTPYSGGLFAFDIFFPYNYPQSPPKVKLVTTGGGNHRFNPNLYAGEVFWSERNFAMVYKRSLLAGVRVAFVAGFLTT